MTKGNVEDCKKIPMHLLEKLHHLTEFDTQPSYDN